MRVDNEFEFRGIKFIPPGSGKAINIPVQKPYTQQALLLAHRCYEQISTDEGIKIQENLEWVRCLSHKNTSFLFREKFMESMPGFTLTGERAFNAD